MTREHNKPSQEDSFPNHVAELLPESTKVLIAPRKVVLLARKILILIIGISIVIVGIVMIVTPGPALIVIPLGLSILASEFYWARRLKEWIIKGIMRRGEVRPKN